MSDPPIRADGRCAVCRKPRKMPKSHHRSIDASVYERDPFCSSTCARIYFGLEPAKPRAFAARTCRGCGCPTDEQTPGCETCRKRIYSAAYELRRPKVAA